MEDFQTSEKTAHLMEALYKVQKEALHPLKNSENPHFRSSYANLESVLNTARETISGQGLTVVQLPLGGLDACRLLVRIQHISGEWLQWVFTAPLQRKDVQAVCAAVTYLRRYSLTSSFNMVDVDDDGNYASKPEEPTNIKTKDVFPMKTEEEPDYYTGTKKQKIELVKIFLEAGISAAPDQINISKMAIDQKIKMKDLRDWVTSL